MNLNLVDRATFIHQGDAAVFHNQFNAEPQDVVGLQGRPFYTQKNTNWYQMKEMNLYTMRPITKDTPLIVTEASRNLNPIAGGNFFSDSLITTATGVNPTNYSLFGTDDIKDRLKARNVSASNPLSAEFAMFVAQQEAVRSGGNIEDLISSKNSMLNDHANALQQDRQYLLDKAIAGNQAAMNQIKAEVGKGSDIDQYLSHRQYTKQLLKSVLDGNMAVNLNGRFHALSLNERDDDQMSMSDRMSMSTGFGSQTSQAGTRERTGGGGAMNDLGSVSEATEEAHSVQQQPEMSAADQEEWDDMIGLAQMAIGEGEETIRDPVSGADRATITAVVNNVDSTPWEQLEVIQPSTFRQSLTQPGRTALGIPAPPNENREKMLALRRNAGHTTYAAQVLSKMGVDTLTMNTSMHIHNIMIGDFRAKLLAGQPASYNSQQFQDAGIKNAWMPALPKMTDAYNLLPAATRGVFEKVSNANGFDVLVRRDLEPSQANVERAAGIQGAPEVQREVTRIEEEIEEDMEMEIAEEYDVDIAQYVLPLNANAEMQALIVNHAANYHNFTYGVGTFVEASNEASRHTVNFMREARVGADLTSFSRISTTYYSSKLAREGNASPEQALQIQNSIVSKILQEGSVVIGLLSEEQKLHVANMGARITHYSTALPLNFQELNQAQLTGIADDCLQYLNYSMGRGALMKVNDLRTPVGTIIAELGYLACDYAVLSQLNPVNYDENTVRIYQLLRTSIAERVGVIIEMENQLRTYFQGTGQENYWF